MGGGLLEKYLDDPLTGEKKENKLIETQNKKVASDPVEPE